MARKKREANRARQTPSTAPATAQRRWLSFAKPLALVIALAILTYANALRNGFTLDDIPMIVENPMIRSVGNVGTIFGANYWDRGGAGMVGDSTLYRPLTVLTYATDFAAWELNAAAYHAVNIALHAAATALVFFVALHLFGGATIAAVAAALFAVHPIHTEAVTSVVGRAELLATLCFLGAFLLLRRPSATTRPSSRLSLGRVGAGGLVYLLGLFSKESAVTLPAVLLLDDWLRRGQTEADPARMRADLATRYGALALAAAVYFALRSQAVMGGSQIWPGYAGVSGFDRMLTSSRVLLEYIGLFVFPGKLLADYWRPEVPIATSVLEPLVLASIAVWLALLVVVVRYARREQALVFSIVWFFLTVGPVSNFLFPIGVAKAERLLYLPSVGLCLAAAWGYGRLEVMVRSRWVPRAALACVLAALAARAVVRNRDWRDNTTLALATLAVSPSSPLMNDIAAGEYFRRGDSKRAIELLQEAVRQAPDMPLIRNHLGTAYLSQGMLDAAIVEYRESIRTNPTDASAYNNLGVAYRDKGNEAEALVEFDRAIRINANYADPHVNIGSLHLQRGRLAEAEAAFAAAVRADPLSARARVALGVVYQRLGQTDRAAAEYREALRLDPTNPNARGNLAQLSAPNDSTASARPK